MKGQNSANTRTAMQQLSRNLKYIPRGRGVGTTSAPRRCSPSCTAGERSGRWRERRGRIISHRNQRGLGTGWVETSRRSLSRQTGEHSDTWVAQSPWCVSGLLVETLLVWIPQEPPVLPNFHQTLDFIAQLQVFIIQTLWKSREKKK